MNEDDVCTMMLCSIIFICGVAFGTLMSYIKPVGSEEITNLKQEYEQLLKDNEWNKEYIEWLQDQLYEKYEEVE